MYRSKKRVADEEAAGKQKTKKTRILAEASGSAEWNNHGSEYELTQLQLHSHIHNTHTPTH